MGWVRAFGILILASRAVAAAAAPATQPAGSIAGKVTSPGEVPLSEMVVYLESPDANRVLPGPTTSVKVSQKGAKFDPPVVIACVG